MSRIGKKPVNIPEGININLDKKIISVEKSGKKLEHKIPQGIKVKCKENTIKVKRENDSRKLRSLHGLTRTIIHNMVEGIDKGYKKRLEIRGRGKRAKVKGKKLVMELGFSHPVEKNLPEDIEAKVEKNIIEISGIDKQQVGEIAAEIRDIKPPEPYKGSGIRYENERVRKKAGKAAVGGGFTGTGK